MRVHLNKSKYRMRHARPRLILLYIFFYVLTSLVNLFAWIVHVRMRTQEIGVAGVNAYIAFASLGLAVFFFGTSPLLYWTYYLGQEMSPRARRTIACLAISINFFVHDFAMTWLEIWLVAGYGWRDVLQGISLFLTVLSFAISFFTVWLSYVWNVSKALQIRYGGAASSNTAKISAVARNAASQRI